MEDAERDSALAFGGFHEDGPQRLSGGHRDLDVWRSSMTLVTDIYELTRRFPDEERFGLVSQLRRAAVSIPTNIAEGYGRETSGSFVQFLRIAQGSAKEVETLIEISKRLDMAAPDVMNPIEDLLVRVSKMLRALIRSIERRR
jgi:four helix bundle protein